MQKYELMAIIENSLDAKAAEKHANDLDKRIEKEFGGKVTFSDFWGERGFAYKINKQKWGYYHVNQFEAEPGRAQELRHELNLDSTVVRFMIIKVDPKALELIVYVLRSCHDICDQDTPADCMLCYIVS